MNDPFDVYIADLFELSITDVFERMGTHVLDLLVNDPRTFSAVVGSERAVVESISILIRSSQPDKRNKLEALLARSSLEALDPELTVIRETMESQRDRIIAHFQNAGIFCATRERANLLMWAHYADQHRGVVFGFRPDLERDSYLRLLEPVEYTDDRPTFYGSIGNMAQGAVLDEAAIRAFNRRLVYSKSTHWSYEAEERIYVPWEVADGEPASYLPFYPEELAELYLGCRATEEFKLEICAAARALNSEVAIYDVRPAKDSYALDFELVT